LKLSLILLPDNDPQDLSSHKGAKSAKGDLG